MHDLAIAWKLTWFGLIVVFLALSLVASTVALFSYLETRHADRKKASQAEAEVEAAAVAEPGISPEVVAAISAALSASLGHKTRIHRIRYRRASPENTWSRQGRISIMASHRTR